MNPLFALSADPKTVAIVALAVGLAALVAAVVVSLGFRVDHKLLAKRKQISDVAAWMKENQLKHAAEIATDLSVGDLPGAIGRFVSIAHMLEDPKTRETLLDGNFEYQLAKKSKDTAWRPKIAAALAAAVPTSGPANSGQPATGSPQ
jgi:hypothetical protein